MIGGEPWVTFYGQTLGYILWTNVINIDIPKFIWNIMYNVISILV